MKKVGSSASTKIPVKDNWVTMAMTDDVMVVELLLRLKHAETTVSDNTAVNQPPLRWGIRKRRSRSSRFGGSGGVLVSMKKDVDFVRASPKTPLSWSGGSGCRGGSASSPSADGFDDISRQPSCSTSTGSGFKIFPANEITNSFSKTRLKKKKSSSELKNEEKLKLKERLDLQKEIASLRTTCNEQNVRNQRLKRIKHDLNSGCFKKETGVDLIYESKCRIVEGKKGDLKNQGSSFFLFDLNVVPSEGEMF